MISSPIQNKQISKRIAHWVNSALFNTANPSHYFQPLVDAIDPSITLSGAQARLINRRSETHDTVTLTFTVLGRWAGHDAGQHIELGTEINGRSLRRFFTISSSPRHFADTGTISITIKANPNGQVSRWLLDKAPIGSLMKLSPATGKFTLRDACENPLWIAAGSGITPVMANLRLMAEQGFSKPTTLLYYSKSANDCIFRDELEGLVAQYSNFTCQFIYTDTHESAEKSGRISAQHVNGIEGLGAVDAAFICGPYGFVESAKTLLMTALEREITITTEAFGGVREISHTNSSHVVTLEKSQRLIQLTAGETLLEASENAGVNPNSGCRMGICHTCKCTKKAGRVRNILTNEISEDANDIIQLCVSVPESDLTLVL